MLWLALGALATVTTACGEDSGAGAGRGISDADDLSLPGDAGGTDAAMDGGLPGVPDGSGGEDTVDAGDAGSEDVPGEDAGLAEDASSPDAEDDAADTHDVAPDSVGDTALADVAEADVPTSGDAGGDPPADAEADAGPLTAARCLAAQLPAGGQPLVDYDRFAPVLGSHCKGTNHQNIVGVQRVVFAGDSLTVGSPPTPAGDWYRNRMATWLADRFGLRAPDFIWQQADYVNGVSLSRTSGDFASCAKWGARTDDIGKPPHNQLETCIPESERRKRHLVIMTVGGNDIFAWAQDLQEGKPIAELQAAAERAVADLETAVAWLLDPVKFPNGVYLVFASNFEFTDEDSAKDFSTCPGADVISMNVALVDPGMNAIATWVMEEYMRIATEYGADLAFMGEVWCGHGHNRGDPQGRCYRGPNTPLWSDLTCMHPNSAGHQGIADVFKAVIAE